MAGDKNSDVEVEISVNQICIMLIKGITRRGQILQYITQMDALSPEEQKNRNWVPIRKGTRQIEIYISRAKEIFLKMAKEERQNVRALYLAQLEDMYYEARQKGHLQTANNIMKNKMYLQGMGGFNIMSTFNIKKFDVELTEEEEAAYKKRLEDIYGE